MSGHGINLDQDITKLSLQDRARLFRKVEAVRLAMQKETDRVKSFETLLETSIIDEVPTDQGIVVDGYSFVTKAKAKPTLKDFGKVFAWAVANDRPDFFQKRLADKAVMDTENWHLIPGIERFNAKSLSVTKR